MADIRGFIAATLDGYIASPDGGIEWLDEFGKFDYGYDAFIAQKPGGVSPAAVPRNRQGAFPSCLRTRCPP